MPKVILLTGAPATGKSTLAKYLSDHVDTIAKVNYGQVILELKKKQLPDLTYEELRARSAEIITAHDVEMAGSQIINWVLKNRAYCDIVIDTHCVTKETYGFRTLPFLIPELRKLRFDAIINLHCPPAVIQHRIRADAGGRPLITTDEAIKHSQLQDGFASVYAIHCACPIYFVDGSVAPHELGEQVISILKNDLGLEGKAE